MTERGSTKEAFANALSLLEGGRADLAERQLREILEEHPDEVNSLRLLGVLRLAAGDAEAAIDHLGRAVALAPDFDRAVLDLCRAHRHSGRLNEATALLRKLCERKLGSSDAWQALGDALIERGDLDGGRDAFRRAARVDPDAGRKRSRRTWTRCGGAWPECIPNGRTIRLCKPPRSRRWRSRLTRPTAGPCSAPCRPGACSRKWRRALSSVPWSLTHLYQDHRYFGRIGSEMTDFLVATP